MKVIAIVIALPIVATGIGFIVGRGWLGALFALVLGTSVAYVAFRLLDRHWWIPCPLCAGRLREDYRNSPRGTAENVEHVCDACSARFIDGELVEQ